MIYEPCHVLHHGNESLWTVRVDNQAFVVNKNSKEQKQNCKQNSPLKINESSIFSTPGIELMV